MWLLSKLSSFWKLSFRDSRRSFISKKELPFEFVEVLPGIFDFDEPGVWLDPLSFDWLLAT